jgi:hypothetical protein
MLPASMAMYLPGCGLDLATSMQQQVILQQLQLQQQLHSGSSTSSTGWAGWTQPSLQAWSVRIALLLHWLLASQGPQHVQVLSPLP